MQQLCSSFIIEMSSTKNEDSWKSAFTTGAVSKLISVNTVTRNFYTISFCSQGRNIYTPLTDI